MRPRPRGRTPRAVRACRAFARSAARGLLGEFVGNALRAANKVTAPKSNRQRTKSATFT